MKKIEFRLSILAILFVAIYVGALVATIHSRMADRVPSVVEIEPDRLKPEESGFVLAELFLPMLIIFTLALSFLLVRRQRARRYERLDDESETDP